MCPNFIGIGAQKAGTSWLHSVLSVQDDIWLPPLKEIHYFDRKFPVKHTLEDGTVKVITKGSNSRGITKRLQRFKLDKVNDYARRLSLSQLIWECKYYFGARSDDWYKSLFQMSGGKISGDITPAYSRLDDNAVKYVHQLLPQVKIIFLIRDPVERAWSHAVMDLTKFSNRSIDQVSDNEFICHFKSKASLLRGTYSKIINRWLQFYSDEQFFIGYFDDIGNKPDKLITDVVKFLGIESDVVIPEVLIKKKVNAGTGKTMPDRYRVLLSELYLSELEMLASMCGDYTNNWLEKAKSI